MLRIFYFKSVKNLFLLANGDKKTVTSDSEYGFLVVKHPQIDTRDAPLAQNNTTPTTRRPRKTLVFRGFCFCVAKTHEVVILKSQIVISSWGVTQMPLKLISQSLSNFSRK